MTNFTNEQLEAWAKLNADTVIDCLAGIEVPQMEGDNLAVTLCSYFENPDQEEDEQGWTPDSIKGYEEVMAAIRDHLAPLAAAPDLARLVLERDAEIAELKTLLAQASDAIEGKTDDLDERICCNGHQCGCMGATNRSFLLYHIRQAMKETSDGLF